MYGETGAAMRAELAALLRYSRLKQRLGAPIEERRQAGDLIRQYRQSVLTWCSTALEAVQPLTFSNLVAGETNIFHGVGTGSTGASPARELRRAIDYARSHSASKPATLDQLTTQSPYALVEHWRNAARQAALAEHDFSPNIIETLTTEQAQAVVSDIAGIAQALVVLDQRYRNLPGWERLNRGERLGWTALAAGLDIGLGQPDFTVDTLGWQPPAKPITGPPKPGILGTLQAEHNLTIALKSFPNAINLRYVLDSQRLVSGYLAGLAERTSVDASARWAGRAETYRRLQQDFRSIAGTAGGGGPAAAGASIIVSRVRALDRKTVMPPRVIGGFQVLFDHVDARIADLIEQGTQDRAYFQRLSLPRMAEGTGNLIAPARQRYVPIDRESHADLFARIARELRPQSTTPPNTPGPTRAEIYSALTNRHPSERVEDLSL